MNSFTITLLASLSAGISAGCFFVILANAMRRLHMEKKATQEKRLPILIKIFMPFAVNLKGIVKLPLFDLSRQKAHESIQMAGFDEVITGDEFIAIRILSACLGLILMGLLLQSSVYSALLMLGLFCVYPQIWLKNTVKKRHLEILKALPNVLDLLTLSVEAGKDLLTAMREIVGRRKIDALGEELRRTLQEIQLGKQRQAALRELGRRVKLPDLSSVVNAIIQAEELGVSIANLLKIQGEQLRSKRFSRAEQMANEAPVKILIPIVLFIFPPVFIVLMGPILIQAFKTFS